MFKLYLENENKVKKVAVIYSGKFELFHNGHKSSWDQILKLKNKFKTSNVKFYIATKSLKFMEAEDKIKLIEAAGVNKESIRTDFGGYTVKLAKAALGLKEGKDAIVYVISKKDLDEKNNLFKNKKYYKIIKSLDEIEPLESELGKAMIYVTNIATGNSGAVVSSSKLRDYLKIIKSQSSETETKVLWDKIKKMVPYDINILKEMLDRIKI